MTNLPHPDPLMPGNPAQPPAGKCKSAPGGLVPKGEGEQGCGVPRVRAYVSIGSNVERDLHVPQCLKELEQRFGKLDISSVYETAAVGFTGDPFYNLVVGFDTELSVEALAAALSQLEQLHGRCRDAKKFAPRTLDLDLILYGDLIRRDAKPYLPREEITRYAFMLEPLAEIAPDLRDPLSGARYADLWQGFDKSGLEQRRVTPDWPR